MTPGYGVRVTQNQPGKWVCKGPQGHVGRGSTRTAAMVAYAMRRVSRYEQSNYMEV